VNNWPRVVRWKQHDCDLNLQPVDHTLCLTTAHLCSSVENAAHCDIALNCTLQVSLSSDLDGCYQ